MENIMLKMVGLLIVSSFIALLLGMMIFTRPFNKKSAIRLVTAFGAGTLLGVAFLDLIPESFELLNNDNFGRVGYGLALGFLSFFILERTFIGFHEHHGFDKHSHQESRKTAQLWLLVTGNITHRALDGIAIGLVFAVSVKLGLLIIIATAIHEVPRTVGDFGMLLSRNMSKRAIVITHIIGSLLAIVLAMVAFSLGGNSFALMPIALSAIAGSFLYIAGSDIIPEIHDNPKKQANLQSIGLIVGLLVILLTQTLFH